MRTFCILLMVHFLAGIASTQESLPDSSALLLLDTYPDSSEVSIDGILRGLTPFPARLLEPGMRVLRITKLGYLDYLDTLHVLRLDTVRIRTRLMRPGHLRVHSDPAGAELFLNDTFRGFTPMEFARLRPGQHRLQLEMDEYQRMTRTVLIPEGDTLAVHVPMTSRYGTFTLTVEPENAMVLINGDSVGIGSLSKYKLLTGRHDLEVRDPDFPTGLREEFFVGPSTDIHMRARLGVHDLVPTAAVFFLPGFSQLRDGSTIEGLALSIGSVAAAILMAHYTRTYATARSEFLDVKDAYREATSEAGALQLHFQLEQAHSNMSKKRDILLSAVGVLGAFLTYNIVDVILNHQFTVNVLETVRTSDGQQSVGMGRQVTIISRITL